MFLVCGEAIFDFFSDAGSVDEVGPVVLRGVEGGSPYNVAIGLARLGRCVALATHIFDDALGRRLEATLRRESVDLSFARRGAGATPLALIEIDIAGVPRYAFHGIREICVHPEISTSTRSELTGIHVGSIPIVSACSSERLLELIGNADGPLISFDPNVRLSVEPDRTRWRTQIEHFRRHAHLIKVSTEDLKAIYGSQCDAHKIAALWVDGETSIVVLTRGENGCVLFSPQCQPLELPAVPAHVVDTVGAGDSFMAAILCWLDESGCARADALRSLKEEQLRLMGEFASRAAAQTCSLKGSDMPRRSQLFPPH